MKHAIRNSLILAVILIAIVTLSYNNHRKLKIRQQNANIELQNLENEREIYSGGDRDDQYLTYLLAKIDFAEKWTIENSKFFLKDENSINSEIYFQNIARRYVPNIRLNFFPRIINSQTIYTLSGTSSILELYTFINYIEKLGALFTIENLTINNNFVETENGPQNKIDYSIDIKPHGKNTGSDYIQIPLRRITITQMQRDPFRPAIYEPITDPNQEILVKHDELTLVSFYQNEAFFVDSQNNLVTLTPDQRVAYGYFKHIDSQNRAVFMINKTGIYETVYQN